MGLMTQLASLLGIETGALIERTKDNAIAFSAIALFALIAVAFLLVALYTWLVGWIGPIWAPLAIAAGALVLALIAFIVLRIQEAAIARRTERQRKDAEATALLASAALSALPDLLNSSMVRNVGLPIALYAGFLMLTGKRKSSATDGKD